MGKKIFIILALVLLVVIVYWKRPQVQPASTPASTTEIDPKLMQRAAEAVPLPRAASSEKFQGCPAFYNSLVEKSVAKILEEIEANFSLEQQDCFANSKLLPATLGSVQACKDFNRIRPIDEKSKSQCLIYLSFFRALRIEELYKNQNEYDSLETTVLVNRILAQIAEMEKMDEAGRAKWRKMTEALLKRMPDSANAIKAHIMTYMMDLKAETLREGSKLYDYIEDGLEKNPNDNQLTELKLFGDGTLNRDFEKVMDFVEANPNNPVGHYHLASMYWRQGKRGQAISALEAALKLSPDDPRFRKTLAQAHNSQNNKDSKIFEVQIGFNFDQL